jgi:hypothetical protein
MNALGKKFNRRMRFQRQRSMCSRIGIHNDCFLASGRDKNTFQEGKEKEERQWLKKEGVFTR